jgi:hypothetical protein
MAGTRDKGLAEKEKALTAETEGPLPDFSYGMYGEDDVSATLEPREKVE